MQARTSGRRHAALEAASSDQPPPDCAPPPQLSGLDALDTAPQLAAAMELLVDHEGPREDTEAAPGEGTHFFPPEVDRGHPAQLGGAAGAVHELPAVLQRG